MDTLRGYEKAEADMKRLARTSTKPAAKGQFTEHFSLSRQQQPQSKPPTPPQSVSESKPPPKEPETMPKKKKPKLTSRKYACSFKRLLPDQPVKGGTLKVGFDSLNLEVTNTLEKLHENVGGFLFVEDENKVRHNLDESLQPGKKKRYLNAKRLENAYFKALNQNPDTRIFKKMSRSFPSLDTLDAIYEDLQLQTEEEKDNVVDYFQNPPEEEKDVKDNVVEMPIKMPITYGDGTGDASLHYLPEDEQGNANPAMLDTMISTFLKMGTGEEIRIGPGSGSNGRPGKVSVRIYVGNNVKSGHGVSLSGSPTEAFLASMLSREEKFHMDKVPLLVRRHLFKIKDDAKKETAAKQENQKKKKKKS